VCQFFVGIDIAHGDKDYLPLDPKVRIAGMIAEYHRAFPFFERGGANVQVICNLDFRWTKHGRQTEKRFPVKNTAALDGHNLTFHYGPPGKETSPMNWARSYFRLGR
jgi:hypothetical protein